MLAHLRYPRFRFSDTSPQFNRCFTTNVHAHVTSIFVATVLGFVVGCTLHALPWTAGFLYNDVIAMNVSAISAAVFTFIWAWKDFQMPFTKADSADSIDGDDSL